MQRGRELGTIRNKGALTPGRIAKCVVCTVEMHVQNVAMAMFEKEMVQKYFPDLFKMCQHRKSKSIMNSKHSSFSKFTQRQYR